MVKKILIYVKFQLMNEIRSMSRENKLHLFFELFNMFFHPIFFAIIFFAINPSDKQIISFASFIMTYNIVSKIGDSYTFQKQNKAASSFILVGMSIKEYNIGTDLIFSFTAIIANIVYSFSLLVLSYLFYNHLLIYITVIATAQLLLLPFVFLFRHRLIRYLNNKIIHLVAKNFNYQNLTILILLLNLRNFNLKYGLMLVCLAVVFLIIINFFDKKWIESILKKLKKSKLGRELKIAVNESNYSVSAMIFTVGVTIIIAAYVVHLAMTQLIFEGYSNVRQQITLIQLFIPLMIIANAQIGLSHYYSFDIEGKRMKELRYLGNFIEYKVRSKLLIAYLVTFPPYFTFLLYYWFFVSATDLRSIIFLVAFVFAFVLHPLFFFLGSLLFPNENRTMFDIRQQMSNRSTFFSITLCLLSGMASYLYAWKSSQIVDGYFLVMVLIDVTLLIFSGVLINKKVGELSS